MKPLLELNGIAIPLEGRNIDTDQIIPARFLKKKRGEYADYLFYDLRFDNAHQPRRDFILNQPVFEHASILVCDENFGCGSSREAAVYAMVDFGIQAILAPSFGDIFYNNCLKNGVLPIVLPADTLQSLRHGLLHSSQTHAQKLDSSADLHIAIDLKNRQISSTHFKEALQFEIDAFWQECLIKGVDEIALTLGYSDQIRAFEDQHKKQQPWLAP